MEGTDRVGNGVRPMAAYPTGDGASARKLKKRELDRKAQRLSRERTRNRIAHLEAVVADYQNNDGRGTLAALTAQLAGVSKEKDCLEAVLTSIERAVQTHRRSIASDGSDAASESSMAGAGNKIRITTTTPAAAAAATTAAIGSPGSDSVSSPEQADMSLWRSSSDQTCSLPLPSKSCACNSNGPPSIWSMANHILEMPCHMTAEEQQQDEAMAEDIAVRITTMGWDSVDNLSPIWRILREVDRVCFALAAQPATKLAMLLIFHRQLRWFMFRDEEDYKKLPVWYHPRPSQAMPHAIAVDFFPWPGVRERFVFSPHRYCSNQFWHLLGTGLRFLWPADLHDAYTFSAADGRFLVTPHFRTRLADISAMTLMPDIFQSYPELSADMPAFQHMPPQLAPRARQVAAGLLAKLNDVYCCNRKPAANADANSKMDADADAEACRNNNSVAAPTRWPGRFAVEYAAPPPPQYALMSYNPAPPIAGELDAASLETAYAMPDHCLDLSPQVLTELELSNMDLSVPLQARDL